MDKPEDSLTRAIAGIAAADDNSVHLPSMQREIQRKFGRNLIRLQQYERLIKALVAEHDIAGPIDELHSIKARQIEAVSKKTLGQVVGDLTGAYIAPAIPESASLQDDGHPGDPNVAWARISFKIEMKEDDFKETERKLADLVNLRNELVHHFLEKYDIWTEEGCLTAGIYLDDCFKQIDTHYEKLRGWAKHNLEARNLMAGFTKSPEFREFFVHGIMPGGAGVFWASSTIVNLLVAAEATFSKDGWTLLQHAIDYIGQHEPKHTPMRYGCSSWRHVLHESEQFEVRREQPAPGIPTVTWYRSRVG
ncbi:MAG: OST-HTH/LOTUS domain-containing protein [Rhodocyclales bacterium]|nr:OST-HTH/LOTUS domain-containing protein [Rhodocyclales bacterium]